MTSLEFSAEYNPLYRKLQYTDNWRKKIVKLLSDEALNHMTKRDSMWSYDMRKCVNEELTQRAIDDILLT